MDLPDTFLHLLENFNRWAYFSGMLPIIPNRLLRDEELCNFEAPEWLKSVTVIL